MASLPQSLRVASRLRGPALNTRSGEGAPHHGTVWVSSPRTVDRLHSLVEITRGVTLTKAFMCRKAALIIRSRPMFGTLPPLAPRHGIDIARIGMQKFCSLRAPLGEIE